MAKRKTTIVEKKKTPVAKAKARKKLETEATVETVKSEEQYSRTRGDVRTREIVNILADEIEMVYGEFGWKLDRVNAEDKALNIVRELRYTIHAPIKEAA